MSSPAPAIVSPIRDEDEADDYRCCNPNASLETGETPPTEEGGEEGQGADDNATEVIKCAAVIAIPPSVDEEEEHEHTHPPHHHPHHHHVSELTKWFQGQVVAPWGGGHKSVALLAKEMEVDPCCVCPTGGYGRYGLTFIHHASKKGSGSGVSKPTEVSIVIETKGGDMMDFQTELVGDKKEGEEDTYIKYQTESMHTDDEALPLLNKYFTSIVRAAGGDEHILKQCVVCRGIMDIPKPLLCTLLGEEDDDF